MSVNNTVSNIENAKINGTFIGTEDHGIFSININFEGDGWSQGTGHYFAAEGAVERWIKGVIKVVGVERWEDLPGKLVRIRRDGGGLSGRIIAVGDIFKDNWFYFEK